MDTTVETAMTICMSCRRERCCTLSPQWWWYITRWPTPKDIILDMLMILNGNKYTCLKKLRHFNECDSNYVGYTTCHLFQCIADHRYSAIGHHLRDAHGNIDLLNENQCTMLKKCSTKWDCIIYEMLYIRTIRPNLNTHKGHTLCLTFNTF